MKFARIAIFILGLTALAGLTVYAGAGAVFQAFAALGVKGLAVIAGLHLPVLVLLGLAWWFIGKDVTGATPFNHVWARLVRDAASEVLPFSQAGGYLIGVRVLHLRGVRAVAAGLSMSVDLVTELWAKLPYIAAGLIALMLATPHASLVRALAIAFAVTIAAALLPVLLRERLWKGMEALAIRISARWPEFSGSATGDIRDAYDTLFARHRNLLAAFGIHLFCWFFGAVETWVILALMGVHATAVSALVIDSLVSTLRTFAFLVPAAAGVQEGAYVLACALFGIPPATAVAVSLARRARELVIALPAFLTWQYLEIRRPLALRNETAGSKPDR